MNNLALLLQDAGEIDEAEAYYLRCVECDDAMRGRHVQLGDAQARAQTDLTAAAS